MKVEELTILYANVRSRTKNAANDRSLGQAMKPTAKASAKIYMVDNTACPVNSHDNDYTN